AGAVVEAVAVVEAGAVTDSGEGFDGSSSMSPAEAGAWGDSAAARSPDRVRFGRLSGLVALSSMACAPSDAVSDHGADDP
ncbi:hypothetical protein KGA66_07075, partial [Actinocrinis puniceicyclus]